MSYRMKTRNEITNNYFVIFATYISFFVNIYVVFKAMRSFDLFAGTTEAKKCLRNVEKCGQLNCQRDEACFIDEQVQYNIGRAVSVVTCANTNPCQDVNCGSSLCVNRFYGDLVPVAECIATLP